MIRYYLRMKLSGDDWTPLGERLVLVVCAVAIVLFACGVIA